MKTKIYAKILQDVERHAQQDTESLQAEHDADTWLKIALRWFPETTRENTFYRAILRGGPSSHLEEELVLLLLKSTSIQNDRAVIRMIETEHHVDAISSNPVVLLWMMSWDKFMNSLSGACANVILNQMRGWLRPGEEGIEERMRLFLISWFEPFKKDYKNRQDYIKGEIRMENDLAWSFSRVNEGIERYCKDEEGTLSFGFFASLNLFVEDVYGHGIDAIEGQILTIRMLRHVTEKMGLPWFNHPILLLEK